MATADLLSLLRTRSGVFVPIFGHLLFQVVLTLYIGYHLRMKHPALGLRLSRYFLLFLIAMLVVGFTMATTMLTNSTPVNLLLFTTFSVLNGILLHMLYYLPADVLRTAAIATVCTFAAMFVVGWGLVAKGVHLGRLNLFLCVGAISFAVSSALYVILQPGHKVRYALASFGVLLFACFVLAQTADIINDRAYDDRPVAGAFQYYLSLFDLFQMFIHLANNDN